MIIRSCFGCVVLAIAVLTGAAKAAESSAVEFCLDGDFDLGVRLQGMYPDRPERYPTRFCVITEADSERVLFSGQGQSNSDMYGSFSVSFQPPDVVRIVNRESPPDIEFAGKSSVDEARRHRSMDPKRLVRELADNPEWVESNSAGGWQRVRFPGSLYAARIRISDGRLSELHTFANMPLRGRVNVAWRWTWASDDDASVIVSLDDEEIFLANGTWRSLSADESSKLWSLSGNEDPVALPGDYWPSRINMELVELGQDTYIVKGVRTGFNHMVVETSEGLIVGDAPAGWMELHMVPPADMVPGRGVSGLSQGLIDFLAEHFPDKKVTAVAVTHAHDDHAGGARAFAAAGADIYAPAEITGYLSRALSGPTMPLDALVPQDRKVTVKPVDGRVVLSDSPAVEIVDMGSSPHVSASIGLWARDSGYFFQSDLHVPNSEDDEPRSDRLATECWFATWAVDNLPDETSVINTHSGIETPVSRLHNYTQSASCQNVPANL